MFQFQQVFEGLGQLEAYISAEEGVAFEMDNKLIWDSVNVQYLPVIHGQPEKVSSSKFLVRLTPSEKVVLQDWQGLYLCVVPVGEDPNFFPVVFVPSWEDVTSQFEVFKKDNKVAFQAYNGLFLASVFRDYYTIAAIKTVADDSCCFRPMIGDINIPTFELVGLDHIDFSRVTSYPCDLKKETFTNRSNRTVDHTFSMSWQTTVLDGIAWKHRWGLGLANSWPIGIKGMLITLEYTEDNDKVVFVARNISEHHSLQVKVPPQSVCTARLLAKKSDYAPVTFRAIIHKVKPNGEMMIMHQPCAWAGLYYSDVHVVYEVRQFLKSCTIM